MSDERWVWGTGLATVTESGTVLDTWFPSPAAGRIPGGYDPAKATGVLQLCQGVGREEVRRK